MKNYFTLTLVYPNETLELLDSQLFRLLAEASSFFNDNEVEKIVVRRTDRPSHIIRQWERKTDNSIVQII